MRAGGAVPLPALARQTVDAGLTRLRMGGRRAGLASAARVRMNAGGHGSDMAHSLQPAGSSTSARRGGRSTARTMTPTTSATGIGIRHRAPRDVVVEAELACRPATVTPGRATIRDIVRWRREHQPGGQNAGSVFTNPPGEPPANSAGWLIDTAGCKGRRRGSAMVSPKHANFIQADDGGSADDVRALIEVVRAEVGRAHGVDLTHGGAPGRLPTRTLNFNWRVMTGKGPVGPREGSGPSSGPAAPGGPGLAGVGRRPARSAQPARPARPKGAARRWGGVGRRPGEGREVARRWGGVGCRPGDPRDRPGRPPGPARPGRRRLAPDGVDKGAPRQESLGGRRRAAGRASIPASRERWTRVRREQGRRRLRILVAAGAVVVVTGLGRRSPCTRPCSMCAMSATRRRRPFLVPSCSSVAGVSHPRPLVDIDAGQVAARLDAVPGLGGGPGDEGSGRRR